MRAHRNDFSIPVLPAANPAYLAVVLFDRAACLHRVAADSWPHLRTLQRADPQYSPGVVLARQSGRSARSHRTPVVNQPGRTVLSGLALGRAKTRTSAQSRVR